MRYLYRLLYLLTTTPSQRRTHEIQDRAAAELPRLISQAGAGIFNAGDYGAKGDSVTDAAPAIQAAVDDAAQWAKYSS